MGGVETAARVAALRERAARAQFAGATRILAAAEDQLRRRQQQLAAVGAPEGSCGADLLAWHGIAGARADAAGEADRERGAALDARTAALACWQDSSRRRDSLEDVARRWRAARQAGMDAAAQRAMDDLGARRKEWT